MDCGRHVVGVVHSEGLGTFTTGSLRPVPASGMGGSVHADIEVSVCRPCHLPPAQGARKQGLESGVASVMPARRALPGVSPHIKWKEARGCKLFRLNTGLSHLCVHGPGPCPSSAGVSCWA